MDQQCLHSQASRKSRSVPYQFWINFLDHEISRSKASVGPTNYQTKKTELFETSSKSAFRGKDKKKLKNVHLSN